MAGTRTIQTEVTSTLGIKHPVLLAGMNATSSPRLVAAVTNAGGMGVIGGGAVTPEFLREAIREVKEHLVDKDAPFGVDVLIPQVGGGARKTNYDYTKGRLAELIDITTASGAKLFVSAVGLPPREMVDRLHAGGVLYMNMVGHPKHAAKAVANGADFICAQGGEAGGHTGEIATSVLIPAVVDVCRGHVSPLTGKPVQVIAGGGVNDGRSLAAMLMFGAGAVWVGTRFILCEESGASKTHQEAVRTAGYDDYVRTLVYSGRPMRARKTPYLERWEGPRRQEMQQLLGQGIRPYQHDLREDSDQDENELLENAYPMLMGQVAARVDKKLSAREIVDSMVQEALEQLLLVRGMVQSAKL